MKSPHVGDDRCWGLPRPLVRWLSGSPARFGPWPLWAWGVKVGWAFDFGPLRIGWLRKEKIPVSVRSTA